MKLVSPQRHCRDAATA